VPRLSAIVSQPDKMVTLRPTRKLRSLLPASPVSARSDTALGDWYVNRIVVDRQPLLLLVSSTSLLPLLVPARDVRGLPDRLSALIEARLRRFGMEAEVIASERQAMVPVAVAPTVDRSVLGIMVDFAKAVPYYLEAGGWTSETLAGVEARLAETPCHAALSSDRVIFPDRKAPELLRAKWLANMPLQPTSGRKIVVH
jgi:hypothetical protein